MVLKRKKKIKRVQTKKKIAKHKIAKKRIQKKRFAKRLVKVKQKPRRRQSKTAIARKKLKQLLKSPNFFVLASHPVMYKRPPEFVRRKLGKK